MYIACNIDWYNWVEHFLTNSFHSCFLTNDPTNCTCSLALGHCMLELTGVSLVIEDSTHHKFLHNGPTALAVTFGINLNYTERLCNHGRHLYDWRLETDWGFAYQGECFRWLGGIIHGTCWMDQVHWGIASCCEQSNGYSWGWRSRD